MENQGKSKLSDFQKIKRLEVIQVIFESAKQISEKLGSEKGKKKRSASFLKAQKLLDQIDQELRKRLSGGITRPGLQNGEQPEFIITKPTTSNETTT
jgi:hypothetical protein